MEKAFEQSKKKLEKMNEQDLMKLDGINGFQKSDDNTLEIRLEIPGNITYNIEKYVEKDKTKTS